MISRNSNNFTFFKLFFYFVLVEIVMGGSGRLIMIGPVSFKMILFGIAMLLTFFNLGKIRMDKSLFFVELTFFLLISFSILIGALNSAAPENIFEDVKPLLFLLMLNFFIIAVDNVKVVYNVVSIIKYFSLIMAVIYIVIVIFLYIGKIDFLTFYEKQNDNEVAFRNQYMFFYKGFLYLGIGFLFLSLSPKKKDKVFSLIVFVALCLTLTRGFIFMTSLVYIFYIFFINKKLSLKIFLAFIGLLILIYLMPVLYGALGDKSESDTQRIITINQVIAEITPISAFIGHGFGKGVPIRPVHMEISFLEIFHKQGVIGLFFWFYILFLNFKYYFGIQNRLYRNLALPFLLSVCFTFMQSLTNPYINNPIGLSIITLSVVIMYKLVEFQKITN